MKIKIMVATHKMFPMPTDQDLYLPVLVGAKKNYKNGMDFQRDDEGKNISSKNSNFNELTALYWGWKNLNADAVGLVHYRRFLSLKRSQHIEDILTNEEASELLSKAPIILPKKRKYYIETNYLHYIHAHREEPIKETRRIIKKDFSDYLDSFDSVMSANSAHMFNMFIMNDAYFKKYAKWLFTILFELQDKIDVTSYSKQEARAFGYVSELLLDVWIRKNKIDYREVKWIQLGGKHTLKKGFFLLQRKLGIKTRTHF